MKLQMRFILILSILIPLTIVRCEQTTNIDSCACDLSKSICDASCCCDPDCSINDLKEFQCDVKEERETVSILDTKCFAELPMYRSNSPYGIAKKDNLVCIAHPRDANVESRQLAQIANQTLTTGLSGRVVNLNSSSELPTGTPVTLEQYQVGTTIFRQTSAIPYKYSIFGLPVASFSSRICSRYQPITFMNDFTSICEQIPSEITCVESLSTVLYKPLCLVQSPGDLTQNRTGICCRANVSDTQFGSNSCANAIQTLNLFIYYSNPIGITGCTVNIATGTATAGTPFLQTFNVQFFSSNASTTKQIRSGNPGYLNNAPLLAGTLAGNTATQIPFTVFQAPFNGLCNQTVRRTVLFRENIQTVCRFSSTAAPPCLTLADLQTLFTSNVGTDIFVGIYGNSDLSNSNQRVLVIRCLSEIGSSDRPVCETGTFPSISAGQCYVRLDIQIGFAETGSVSNPQQVIGTVVFHYQRLSSTATSTLASPVIITQTVTFQDLSNAPVTAAGLISRPNTRILGDFFYPFSLSRASMSLSFSFSLLVFSFLAVTIGFQ